MKPQVLKVTLQRISSYIPESKVRKALSESLCMLEEDIEVIDVGEPWDEETNDNRRT